ncbi:MAG: GMC family oxidoreductase N-terminal domain-containing protein [Myxococcales bacterium]|nr:GMC family oxidoreductase N-terminal domain-containing protein [Myxococcales bacterium]MDH3843874.1 GMC family oxidoreductase N-terminal domain-containing protein [Myxococcales bacterium]
MPKETFDFIVVGAGSAGCCVANRLSANPDNRVLLIEAGGKDNNPLIKMPIGYTRLMYDEKTTNLYKTEPEPHLNGRQVSVVRGRVLGGCSSINGMVYMRGQKQDYDDWGALRGCGGWSYANVLPYFKRSEHYEPGLANDYHAKGGELNVTYVETKYPITDVYIEAAVSVGIPRNDDVNGEAQEGIGYIQVNMKNGRRWSSADAFLSPDVRRRPNLEIVLHATAKRLLLEGRRAVAVEYADRKDNTRIVRANREVIVCAGTYNSPPLLELSGIGNRKALNELGVEVKHELRGIGENLQDHYQCWVQHGVKTKSVMSEDGKFPRVVWSTLKYLLTKKGALAMPACNVGGFIPNEGAQRPIFQIHFTPGAGAMDEDGNMVASPVPGVNSTVCIVRPTSRGSVHARSTDPKAFPRIVHNYLSTEHDRKLAIEGFKLQRRIYGSDVFQEHATQELRPGDHVQSDDEILDFWKVEGMSLYHPVGSMKMGPADDPAAVVDNELRVHGIEGLRIVDASIFPLLPSGNTHAPTVAVAERASDLILGKNARDA